MSAGPAGAAGAEIPAEPAAGALIAPGDRVVALEPSSGRRWLLVADAGARKEKGLGVMDPGRFIGTAWGSRVEIAGKPLVLLRPDLGDVLATLRRKAAIILPKDAARLLHGLGVGPGDRVFESGIGSGATTACLAWAVGEGGRVVVQELREDFRDWALENLERAGLDDRVEVHTGDLTEGVAAGVEGPFTAALLDQPEPWRALPHIMPLIAVGGRLACYCPQVSQVEQTVRAMESVGCAEVEALEVIERRWEVKERGSRPSHEGLLHTAFLVLGRRI